MSGSCQVALFGASLPLPVVLALAALGGAALPLLFNYLFMSRKDRTERDQTRFANAKDMLATQTDRRNDFTAALAKAVRKSRPSIDDIHTVMKTGEAYFETLKIMAQAIIDGRVSDSVRDRDFVPKISEALRKNIPLYYETLARLCSQFGMAFDGRFQAENYEGLLRVVDLYDHECWVETQHKLKESL